MAPNIDKEAEHLKNKARKELLGLLEGVSKRDEHPAVLDSEADRNPGPWQEESGDWKRFNWTPQSLCPIYHPQRLWRRQSL